MSNIYIEYHEELIDNEAILEGMGVSEDDSDAEDWNSDSEEQEVEISDEEDINVISVLFTPVFAYRNPIEHESMTTIPVKVDFDTSGLSSIHILVTKNTVERDDGSILYGKWDIHSVYKTRREAILAEANIDLDDEDTGVELYSIRIED
jgi:hypothetical protein